MTAGRPAIAQDGRDVLLAVRVQPRASRNQLVIGESRGPDSITIRVTAPPAEGAANAACRAFLADVLGIAGSRIVIARGRTARQKVLRIRDAEVASILARFHSAEKKPNH